MNDWYEKNIEEPIRPVVRLLRDNGFNTSCSCGHVMYVKGAAILDGELHRLHCVLYNAGYRLYDIRFDCSVSNGELVSRTFEVSFPGEGRDAALLPKHIEEAKLLLEKQGYLIAQRGIGRVK